MNSILHILQQLPYFTIFIYDMMFEKNLKKKLLSSNNSDIQKYLIYQLYKLFKLSLDNDDSVITPYGFKQFICTKNSIWSELNQQDSEEFFSFLISTLKEEIGLSYEVLYGNYEFVINSEHDNEFHINHINQIIACNIETKYNSKEYSILSSLFNGFIQVATKCMCCNAESYMYESFLNLQLSIPQKNNFMNKEVSLYNCLDEFINYEQLDEHNMRSCDLCGLSNRAYKRTLLWKTSKILTIHLKRFSNYDMITGITSEKITKNIIYPIENLDLTKYFTYNSPYKFKTIYDLVGINIHKTLNHKKSIDSGHYISIIKNLFTNKWYLYNDDDEVKELNPDYDLQTKDAYILFYCKKF